MERKEKFFNEEDRKDLEQEYNTEFIDDMDNIFSNPFFKLSQKEQIDYVIKNVKNDSRIWR